MPATPTESLPLALGRNRTANGGWEWFLLVDGERVYAPGLSVGVFTGPGPILSNAVASLARQWERQL